MAPMDLVTALLPPLLHHQGIPIPILIHYGLSITTTTTSTITARTAITIPVIAPHPSTTPSITITITITLTLTVTTSTTTPLAPSQTRTILLPPLLPLHPQTPLCQYPCHVPSPLPLFLPLSLHLDALILREGFFSFNLPISLLRPLPRRCQFIALPPPSTPGTHSLLQFRLPAQAQARRTSPSQKIQHPIHQRQQLQLQLQLQQPLPRPIPIPIPNLNPNPLPFSPQPSLRDSVIPTRVTPLDAPRPCNCAK